MISGFFRICVLNIAMVLIAAAANAGTLKDVQRLDFVNCGANGSLPGFAVTDKNGKWTGFDVDLCRALAAAVLASAMVGLAAGSRAQSGQALN